MRKNEVRTFKISGDAINELLWELLNKNGGEFLDISDGEEKIFCLKWNKEKDELVFYALEFENPRPVNFDVIDKYIDEHIGITTKSLFNPDEIPYVKFLLDDIEKSGSQ